MNIKLKLFALMRIMDILNITDNLISNLNYDKDGKIGLTQDERDTICLEIRKIYKRMIEQFNDLEKKKR